MPIGLRNDELLDMLQGEFQRRFEPNFAWGNAVSLMSLLPGLRGFWPMSSVHENGNALDLGGRGLTLTYTGNPTYNVQGLAPYIDLDGVGDYLVRLDEAALDITGTETFVAASKRGLTLGGWFWLDSLVARRPLVAKYTFTASNNRAYQLSWNLATTTFGLSISVDGIVATVVNSSITPVVSRWYFVVGRFTPSTEIAVFANGVKTTNVVAIPASIFNSTANFFIGTDDDLTALLDGRASLVFLCAESLSDAVIKMVYEQTRALFGVK
jgi:hypothetical protein